MWTLWTEGRYPETTDLITEITLQPWRAFQPDGVILFSDILTPLPAIGIPFEIDDYKVGAGAALRL